MKRILIFIGLKIAEILGFCLFMLLLAGFILLAKKYLVFAILKWVILSICAIFFVAVWSMINWEKATKLKERWFNKEA